MLQRSHPTNHPMSLHQRSALATMLNDHMASSLDLFSQLKHAHWNVRGRTFQPRHELFDQLAKDMLERVDTLAERVGGLGFEVHGTARMAGQASNLPAYDLHAAGGQEHIRALASRYGSYIAQLRDGLQRSEQLGDPVTSDVLTQVLVAAEHELWLLESHMEPRPDMAETQLPLDVQERPEPTVETAPPAGRRMATAEA